MSLTEAAQRMLIHAQLLPIRQQSVKPAVLPPWLMPDASGPATITDMVTKQPKQPKQPKRPRKAPPTPKPRPQYYLYIQEWRKALGLSGAAIAREMQVDRVTVSRYENPTQQHRLRPAIEGAIARAMSTLSGETIHPEQFWRPPSRPSADAYLRGASKEDVDTAIDVVRRIVRRPKDEGERRQ